MPNTPHSESFPSQPPEPDQTVVGVSEEDLLDAGLAAAFASDSGLPIPADASVLKALGAVLPGWHPVALREAEAPSTPESEAESGSDRVSEPSDTYRRLVLHEEIARGGMGAVHKGRDIELGRELAVKVLLETHHGRTDLLQRFVEEAQIQGQLQHPGVAPVYEMGQLPNRSPYFTMKLVKGQTLARLLTVRSDSTTELSRFLGIFEQICQTLAYAHARGVIHRDLKPSNVMVGAFGEVQVMDWGLAKVLPAADANTAHSDPVSSAALSTIRTVRSEPVERTGVPESRTQVGSVLGTPAYMAPEQARGEVEGLDERADVFGLGAILCEILTGRPPYAGKDATDIWRKATEGVQDEARAALDRCGADRDLVLVASRAMSVDRQARQRHAGELATAITAYLAGVQDRLRVAELQRVEAQARADGERKRRRITLALAASILVAVVTMVSGVAWVSKLADIHSKELAQKEAAAARNEQRLLKESNESIEKERKAAVREAERAQRQARIAEANRLAALSATSRTESPAASVMLAVESGLATRPDDEGLLLRSHQALLDSLIGIAGRTLTVNQVPIRYSVISSSGRWLASPTNSRTIALLDLEADDPMAHPRMLGAAEANLGLRAISSDGQWLVTENEQIDVELWNLASAEPAASRQKLFRGTNSYMHVKFSPDNVRLVIADQAGTLRTWNLLAAEPLKNTITLSEKSQIHCLAFNWNGRKLAAGSLDGIVRVWDFASADPTAFPVSFVGNGKGIEGLEFCGVGEGLVARGADQTIRLLSGLQTGAGIEQTLAEVGGVSISAMAVDLGASRLVTGGRDKLIRFWNLPSSLFGNAGVAFGARTASRELLFLAGHTGRITDLTAAGRWLVSSSTDNTVLVWDLLAADPAANPRVLPGTSAAVAVNQRGRVVTRSHDGTMRVWDLSAAYSHLNPLLLPAGEQDLAAGIAISPDSRWIATAGSDNSARLWDLHSSDPGAAPLELVGHSKVLSMAFSPDGRWMVTGTADNTSRIWNLTTENPNFNPRYLRGHTRRVTKLTISPDSRWLVTACARSSTNPNSELFLWDLQASDRDAPPSHLARETSWISRMAISPDSRWLATRSVDGNVRLWDLKGVDRAANPRVISDPQLATRCVTFSPNGHWLVTGGHGGTVKVWDFRKPESLGNPTLLDGHQGVVLDVTISPDSRWLFTSCEDKTTRMWDLLAERPAATSRVVALHETPVFGGSISPDGRWLLTHSDDAIARIADLHSTDPLRSTLMLRHEERVDIAAVSPDGRWFVTACQNGKVRAWQFRWEDLVTIAKQGAGRNFTHDEWQHFFPGEPYRTTFSDFPDPGKTIPK